MRLNKKKFLHNNVVHFYVILRTEKFPQSISNEINSRYKNRLLDVMKLLDEKHISKKQGEIRCLKRMFVRSLKLPLFLWIRWILNGFDYLKFNYDVKKSNDNSKTV